ncbi:MAG: carboxypeptidase M32 [Planctomycetota bacterium]|jgi:carboxypeptidase Taq
MAETSAYEDLLERVRKASLLGSSAAVLSWDQETMMPKGGVEHRARQLSQLAELTHEMAVHPRVGELLQACESVPELTADPASDSAANLRELRRSYDRRVRLPRDLVAELAEVESLAQHHWAAARKAADFKGFRPWLERLVALHRRKADCLMEGTDHRYGEAWDALAEGFEPGARASELTALLGPLAAKLRELICDLRDNGTPPADAFLRQQLPIAEQEALVRFVSGQMGFDFDRGRLDQTTHPFCSGSHPGDVRITIRFSEDNVVDALGSTMHESGHGLYEQGLPTAHVGTPLGHAISIGVHESQSRLWENHVGRSAAFWRWCAPHMQRIFGAVVKPYSAKHMYGAANLVKPDFIRVEADEATYNLHVLVRFELELALIRGDLTVPDLPGAWNDKYRDYLGLEVPDDAKGCLQDVHWSCGMFGYFPTYTLGNLFAAQLFERARDDFPDLDAQIEAGQFGDLRAWLNEHVHRHGSRYPAAELVQRATGKPLGTGALLRHLSDKLRPLYGLR